MSKPSTVSLRDFHREEHLPSKRVKLEDTIISASALHHGGIRNLQSPKRGKQNPPRSQEYDEGMNFFGHSHIRINNNAHQSTQAASILYNEGQTHVGLGNYPTAKEIFVLASSQLGSRSLQSDKSTLFVRINHYLGYCNFRLGNIEESMICFKTALAEVKLASLGELYEAATINCIGVLLYHREVSSLCESLSMFKQSLNVFERYLGADALKVATVLNNIGRVHYFLCDYKEALTVYEQAASIRRQHLGDRSIDVAATISNTGRTLQKLGQLDTAMLCYQEFLQIAISTHHGSHRRDVVSVVNFMAEIHKEQGDLEKAREVHEHALKEARAALGSFDPDVASTLNKLGNVCSMMSDPEMALKFYGEGLKVEQAIRKPSHPFILAILLKIAQTHKQSGDFQAALAYFQDIHCRTVKAHGPNSLECAHTLSNSALMQYMLQDYQAALDTYQEALVVERECYGDDDNLDVASSLNSIGLVLFHQGAECLAKECFYDSLRIRKKILGANHHDVATIFYNIATFHLETGDSESAIKYYKETLRIERAVFGSDHQDVLVTLQHIGLIHHQRDEADEALHYLYEALRIERTLPKDSRFQEAASKLLNLIGNIHMQTTNVGAMMESYCEADRLSTEELIVGGNNAYVLRKMFPPGAPAA